MDPSPPLNQFAGLSLTLDRAGEQRDDAAWLQDRYESSDSRFLTLDERGNAWLLPGNTGLRWLSRDERQHLLAELPVSLIGLIDQQAYFMVRVDDSSQAVVLDTALASQRANLRSAAMHLSATEASLFAYAKGLAHWQRETRYCSYCGHTLHLIASGHRARCGDTTCGRLHFPRTDAAIITIVEQGDACLLGRQSGWPPGRFSTLAGFVEPGESLEDAVRREVAEEAGVVVDNIRYHSSQPWPMPASLMIGFTATAISHHIQLRDGELEEARWFTAKQIATGIANGSFLPPPPISVAYHLLELWLRQRANMDLAALMAATVA